MSNFTQSVSKIFKGALKAFWIFPASIGCAAAFAIVTMIRIQLDWQQQEPFNFLFDCLHWSFALGAVFGLTLIVAERSRVNRAKTFLTANLLAVVAAAVTFVCLYLFSGKTAAGVGYTMITPLAAARVSAAILISFITFIILAGYQKDRFDFTDSFFMTHKAFFIALIYGLVIMLGAFGVARAVESLLYHEMSSKVYMYIGTLAGFLTFTIFAGYFPDFRKDAEDEHRKAAQEQPRFIEILFVYIMIPIVLALTAVLLIWTGKTVLSGMQVTFLRLSVIAASYTIGGLWLHAMVSEHESRLAKAYRSIYPAASLVILIFEAWAVLNQLKSSGLKVTEYIFILIWVIAAAGAILLILMKSKAHSAIAVLVCVLTVFAVLPAVGYHALPVTAQANRLQTLLINQKMFANGKIIPAVSQPDQMVREKITDAVMYLAGAQDAKLPAWFDPQLGKNDVFKTKLGFEQTWPNMGENNVNQPGGYKGTYLYLPSQVINIGNYDWAIGMQSESQKGPASVTLNGIKGSYQIFWTIKDSGMPSLKILLNNHLIIEQDMSDYINRLSKKYPPVQAGNTEADLDDMCLKLETPEISALLVFNSIQFSTNSSNSTNNYWFVLKDLYLKEKP